MDFDIWDQDSNIYSFIDDDTNDEYFDTPVSESWDNDHDGNISFLNLSDQSITDSNQENNSLALPKSKSKSKSKSKQNSENPTHKPRTNLIPYMDYNQIHFMETFYQHFTGKKTDHVRKEIICKYYHPLIVQKLASKYNYKIRLTKREEQRCIQKYFMNFAPHEHYIMMAINDLEKENLINYQLDIIEFHKKISK